MSPHRKLVSTLAILIATGLAAPAQATDLLAAYKLARQNDPSFAAAKADYRAELETRPQARAALLPQVTATANYADVNEEVSSTSGTFDEDYTREELQLELRQPLFDWSAFAGLDRADAVVGRAEADLAAAQQNPAGG